MRRPSLPFPSYFCLLLVIHNYLQSHAPFHVLRVWFSEIYPSTVGQSGPVHPHFLPLVKLSNFYYVVSFFDLVSNMSLYIQASLQASVKLVFCLPRSLGRYPPWVFGAKFLLR